jgi:putative DNA primase/helicase
VNLEKIHEVKQQAQPLPVTVAIGKNRSDTGWKNEYLTWDVFIELLKKPRVTNETMAQYDQMTNAEKSKIKDGRSFVGGFIKGGRRKAENVESRSLVTLDVDFPNKAFVLDVDLLYGGNAGALYTTHSSRPEKEKYRYIAALSRGVSSDEYAAIARWMADKIGMGYFDHTTFRVNQLMYFPSCSKDASPEIDIFKGPPIDVDALLEEYQVAGMDWKNPAHWPKHPKENKQLSVSRDKLTDPREKPREIGAFCRAYSIEEGIDEFLSDIYETAGENRYTFKGGDSWGGLEVFPSGHAYSYQDSDPAANGHCHNVFDLVRIHKFGELDDDMADKTTDSNRPSNKAMVDFVMNDPKALIEYKTRQHEQMMEDFSMAEETGEINPNIFFDGKRFVPMILGTWFMDKHQSFLLDGKELYVYQNGVYSPGEQLFLEEATKALGDKFNDGKVKDAWAYVRNVNTKVSRDTLLNTGNYRNVQNGILNLDNLELERHSPDFKAIVQIPTIYDPNAETSVFDEFLRRVAKPDTIPVIEEFIGYVLWPSVEFEKALILCGDGGNGKGTLLALIKAVFGDKNCSAVELQLLTENIFAAADLYGKLANIDADIPSRTIENSAIFKKLVSGDKITVQKKHRDPFELQNTAKLIFSANEPPMSKDNSGGFHRRPLLVPFETIFTDRELRAKLFTPEGRSGALLRGIQGLQRLLNQGGFSKSVTIEELLHRYRKDSDTVLRFLEEYCAYDETSYTGKSHIYQAYREMCRSHGNYPVSQAKFNAKLQATYPGVTEDRNGTDGRRWKNLSMKSPTYYLS